MTWTALLHGLVGLVAALTVGTLVEYFVHRLMHDNKFLSERHRRHHKNADAQGVVGEFIDYLIPTSWGAWFGFLVSVPAGIGYLAGALLYPILAAYAHQLHHERPELIFWMRRPVHYLHHRHNMWDANFGILVDIWDRVFGTYDTSAEWQPAKRPFEHHWREFFDIGWLRRGGLVVPAPRPRAERAESMTSAEPAA